jgi:hypothetical protein
MEAAAGWRMERRGNFAVDCNKILAPDLEPRYRRQQRLGMGIAGPGEQLFRRHCFNDPSERHDDDELVQVLGHAEVVAAQKIIQLQLLAQFDGQEALSSAVEDLARPKTSSWFSLRPMSGSRTCSGRLSLDERL